jgi:acyl-CoA synthetase (AMP-forming)/AMP-acid ligase II
MRADERFGTIPNMAIMNADRFGDAISVADGDLRLSFADIARTMKAVARALMEGGVEPGDRVGLWAPNSALWIPTALGIQAAGAWLVPINTRFKAEEVAYVVEKAGISFLFSIDVFLGSDYLSMLEEVFHIIGRTVPLVVLPPPCADSGPSWNEFLTHAADVDPDIVNSRVESLRSEDISDVIFTSGTTGFPKGVLLRHGASLRGYESFNRSPGLDEGDRHLVVMPFFHCFGYKAGWMLDLMVGATTYPLAVFEPESVMALIEQEGITHFDGSPTVWLSLLDHPAKGRYDLSSLRAGNVGAAAMPADLIERLREDLGMKRAISGYGLTENHALVALADPRDPVELISTTAGHPLPGVDLKILDPDGVPVQPGQNGEICVRGYLLMSGYYNDPEATAAVVVDDWLLTGDVGFLGEDGCLRITDRKKDIFVTGGFNVAPVEVEKALLRFDPIGEVAVVGVPDERWGEVGVAFVVPKLGAALTPEDVVTYASERLANFKVPRLVMIVGSLPRNAVGKVVKSELRQILEEDR